MEKTDKSSPEKDLPGCDTPTSRKEKVMKKNEKRIYYKHARVSVRLACL